MVRKYSYHILNQDQQEIRSCPPTVVPENLQQNAAWIEIPFGETLADARYIEIRVYDGINRAAALAEIQAIKHIRVADKAALDDLSLFIGESKQAPIAPAGGTDEILTGIVWTSENPEIFTVDESGMVTGRSAGTAKLIASNCAGLRAEAAVTVTAPYYVVTFNANGGTVTPASAQTVDNKLPELPVPVREGYRFLGWFQGGTEPVAVTTETIFTADTEIYAQWESTYTVTFEPLNGEAEFLTAQTVAGKLEKLPDCKKPGYTFVGWFDQVAGGSQITLDQVYTADTTLYARWKVENPMPYEYRVTFHANGVNTEILIPMNEAIGSRMPANPVREGYLFTGWNTALDSTGDPVTADTVIDCALDAYAQWEAVTDGDDDEDNEDVEDIEINVRFVYRGRFGRLIYRTCELEEDESILVPRVKPFRKATWVSSVGDFTIRSGERLSFETLATLLGDDLRDDVTITFTQDK